MKKILFKVATVLSILGSSIFSCTKENTQYSDIQSNNTELSVIEAGVIHNDVCKNLLKATQQYKNDGLTVVEYDSIFLTMYPEFTQTDLDEYKSIIKKTQTKGTTEIYDSIRSNIDYNEREMYRALDSLLLSYKNTNDLNLVISELELLFSVIESDQTMDAIYKYCGLSTIDISNHSIELWNDVIADDKSNDFTEAIISDINMAHTLTMAYIATGQEYPPNEFNSQMIFRASAYASMCTYFDIEIGGWYPIH
jgi:hypothetical protein